MRVRDGDGDPGRGDMGTEGQSRDRRHRCRPEAHTQLLDRQDRRSERHRVRQTEPGPDKSPLPSTWGSEKEAPRDRRGRARAGERPSRTKNKMPVSKTKTGRKGPACGTAH